MNVERKLDAREAEFQSSISAFLLERTRLAHKIAFLAYPAFYLLDLVVYPQHAATFLLIRAVTVAFLVLTYALTYTRFSQRWPAFLAIASGLAITHSISTMAAVTEGFLSQYYVGTFLVLFTWCILLPWKLSDLVAYCALHLTGYFAIVLLAGHALDRAAVQPFFFLLGTQILACISTHSNTRARRREFELTYKLREMDRLKSEFFANISHELRTPLTLILGAFKTLSKLFQFTEHEVVVQAGMRNSASLLFKINELLALAKFDGGRAEVRKQCLDVSTLIRNVAANFESSQKERVHLRGVGEPVLAELDPRQMKIVLFNLLSNAFKFSDPDEGQVWLKVKAHPESIQLEIEDNGIGIPREQLDRIFDRFTQVEGSATRRHEGTGIGLALVKEIISLHSGQIRVESEVGKGSTFTIALPRGQADPGKLLQVDDEDGMVLPQPSAAPSSPETEEQEIAGPATGRLILIADDNSDMRSYLKRLLAGAYRVAVARHGGEALEKARRLHPDLILTDVMMPGMSGKDLLNAVRTDEALRRTPIIFLTARTGSDAHAESLDAGADDYIAKPFDEHELLARVQNAIRARVQEREIAALQRERLARFLPQHLADAILFGGRDDLLQGHRAHITVVFIDLRGFTAFAESADPEDLVAVLRQYHAEMGRLAAEAGGTIERFSGDAVMVFFNDPIPAPNHPELAIRMALAMRERVSSLRDEWSERGIDLGAGLGIATGYATIGVLGYEGRQDYAAVGVVTNLAARLCGEAQHGQIVVSERVLYETRELVDVEPLGQLTLKGFTRPVAAYNVLAIRQRQLAQSSVMNP